MRHHLTIKLDQNKRGPIQIDGKDIACISLAIDIHADHIPTATIKIPLKFIDIDIEKCTVVIEKPAEQITLADVLDDVGKKSE